MAWVVKAFTPELVQAAEREARRLRRMAGREAADAAAHLLVLEQLGRELREGVRAQRRDHPAPHAPEPLPIPRRRAAPQPVAPSARRASLRDSPLSDLFRATG